MKSFRIILLLLTLVSCRNDKSTNKIIKTHNPTAEIPQMFTVLEAEDLFYEAASVNKNGDYLSARKLLINSLEYEINPITYNEIGISYLGEKDFEKAIGYFEKAIQLDSTYYPSHLNLARSYLATNEFENGKKVLFNVISNCESEYWKAYGNMYLALFYFNVEKNCEKALDALVKSRRLKNDPDLSKQYELFESEIHKSCK